MIIAPAGISESSKLTNPRVTRLVFLPARISSALFPPLLLERNPSSSANDVIILVLILGVGDKVALGVTDGFFVGLKAPLVKGSVAVGDGAVDGPSETNGVCRGVGVGVNPEFCEFLP